MDEYIGTKQIKAKPMNRLEYNQFRGWTLPADENGEDEGYLVEYNDGGKPNTEHYKGYVSWSPKEQFEKAYKQSGNFSFGDAIVLLKQGKKVARKGWNGKGMYLWLKPATTIQASWCKDPILLDIVNDNGGEAEAVGTICMRTADNKILTGWLASQTDILTEDWIEVFNHLNTTNPTII